MTETASDIPAGAGPTHETGRGAQGGMTQKRRTGGGGEGVRVRGGGTGPGPQILGIDGIGAAAETGGAVETGGTGGTGGRRVGRISTETAGLG